MSYGYGYGYAGWFPPGYGYGGYCGKGFGKGHKGKDRGKEMLRGDPELKVWVGGIPESLKWKELQTHMEQAGKTKWVEVFAGKGKGTAAVVYATAEEAAKAVATLNGSTVGGGVIEVDKWVKLPKPEESAAPDAATAKASS
ncbi:unnamed protein product [Prorocentrum cordatum]|uniref:RRM domain-containing protein n=1 Tax=Prorocentrum cordatum TaxID=2364126 RepID=A0ABN9R246_9DINO|nr:unnamed protein product [Polarella glacialis]